MDRNLERRFLHELLNATRSGRVVWTPSIKPGCQQFLVGDHLLAIAEDEGQGPSLSLHHVSGHLLETLRPGHFPTDQGGDEVASIFVELIELARMQSVGLPRRWRGLTKHVAGIPGPVGEATL